eukprot:g14900.t1
MSRTLPDAPGTRRSAGHAQECRTCPRVSDVTTGQVELDYRALFDDTETARVQQQNATANANAYDPTTRHYFAYKDFVLFEHPVLCMVLFSIVGCGLLATRSLVLSGVSAEQVK